MTKEQELHNALGTHVWVGVVIATQGIRCEVRKDSEYPYWRFCKVCGYIETRETPSQEWYPFSEDNCTKSDTDFREYIAVMFPKLRLKVPGGEE